MNIYYISCSSFMLKLFVYDDFLNWKHYLKTFQFFFPPYFFLPSPLFSLPSLFPVPSLFHELILKHWASFSLQLSPEEGYVSAKEDSFFYPPHSCEEEGLADKALFRADLALVSGALAYQAFFQNLKCVVFLLFKTFWSLTVFFVHYILENLTFYFQLQ